MSDDNDAPVFNSIYEALDHYANGSPAPLVGEKKAAKFGG